MDDFWILSKLLKSFKKLLIILKINLRLRSWKDNFCPGLHIGQLENAIFICQSNYIESPYKWFYMDKANLLSSPIVVRALDLIRDPSQPQEENEEFFFVLKYHNLVEWVLCCIMLLIQDLISPSKLICYQDNTISLLCK